MILIISDSIEKSTTDVIDWLRYLNAKFIRINFEDKITIKRINFEVSPPEIIFQLNDNSIISTKEIKNYWYRRGGLTFPIKTESLSNIKNQSLKQSIENNLFNEYKTVKDFLYTIIEDKQDKIGSFFTKENNKLIHLTTASNIGLSIPETLVCTKKSDLLIFYKKNNQNVIVKAIGDSFTHLQNSKKKAYKNLVNYTHLLTEEEIKSIPNEFPITLFQKNLQKMWELRIFYLFRKFYAMAIFSQNDDSTKIDFRRYNLQKQNRRIPFILPNNIKKKLNQFMKENKLETGSIDMIYTKDGEYIFLEVNPVGQFGMVSNSCNYQLEKRIAFFLNSKYKYE